ncbi:hypothetical protein L486_02676 [Kwoniella mangroviensis CBS 10435]|uniref:Uncharacterized protein n=1 Tax=Kwoniella mangroviensis CBS 10435 TaxID=1331196 RepID=A0A1B9IWV5_9TREE|nr:hypothetical protein L486_02676 [Kwoniella mangroviensis CBS 10435]OCF70923.1 hypothetical protein I204_08358 [Kwoniella mangroviensis CBS 8886]
MDPMYPSLPHSLSPRPMYPLGRSLNRPPDHRGRLIDSWRASSSSTDKRKSVSWDEGVETVEEGIRVFVGQMEDDTPVKKRKLPIDSSPRSSPTRIARQNGLSVTVETLETLEIGGTSIMPQVYGSQSYRVERSLDPCSLPTPRTIPLTTQLSCEPTAHTAAHTAALLRFFSESDIQTAISLLPSMLSPADRQSLVDLKQHMSRMDGERSYLRTKVTSLEDKVDSKFKEMKDFGIIHAGVSSELKIVKEKYRKLKVMYEQKEETVLSLNKSIGDMKDRHESRKEEIESKLLELETQHEKVLRGLNEKHNLEIKRKLEEVDTRYTMDIAMLKSSHMIDMKEWKNQAENLLAERNIVRKEQKKLLERQEALIREVEKLRMDENTKWEETQKLELKLLANQREITSLICQVEELGSVVTVKNGEVHCLEIEKDVLEKLMKKKQDEVDKLNNNIHTLKGHFDNHRQLNDQLAISHESVRQENAALKECRSTLEDRIVKLESEAKQDLERSTTTQREMNEQIHIAQIKISSIEDEKKAWIVLAEDRQRDNIEWQKKVDRLEKQLSESAPTVARGSVRSAKASELIRKEKSTLEEELKELQSERVWFWDELNGYKDKDAAAKAELYQSEDRNRRLEKELGEAKISCDDLKGSLELAELKAQEAEAQLEQLSAKDITSDNTISLLQDQMASLQANVKKLERCKVAVEKEEKERESGLGSKRLLTVQSPSTHLFEKRLANSEQRVTNLQLQVAGKDAEIEKLKDLKRSLERRCNSLDQSNKDRDRRLNLCKAKMRDLEKIVSSREQVIIDLRRKLEEGSLEREGLEKAIEKKQQDISMLNQKLVDFQADLDRYISDYQCRQQDSPITNRDLKMMAQLKTRHGESVSFTARIMDRVTNRADQLRDLLVDHRAMKNEMNYNVARREFEHCSYLLKMLKDLNESERELGKLIDDMGA